MGREGEEWETRKSGRRVGKEEEWVEGIVEGGERGAGGVGIEEEWDEEEKEK